MAPRFGHTSHMLLSASTISTSDPSRVQADFSADGRVTGRLLLGNFRPAPLHDVVSPSDLTTPCAGLH